MFETNIEKMIVMQRKYINVKSNSRAKLRVILGFKICRLTSLNVFIINCPTVHTPYLLCC